MRKFLIGLLIGLLVLSNTKLNRKVFAKEINYDGFSEPYYMLTKEDFEEDFEDYIINNSFPNTLNKNSYFSNLYNYSPMNSHGSCGYVSLAQYLSYYDTFYNDNIIPESYERNQGTASSLSNAVAISPGVLKQEYPSSDLYSFIQNTKSYDYQMYLMYIKNYLSNVSTNNYSCSIGMWDYNIIFNYLYNNAVSFEYYSYANLYGGNLTPKNSNIVSWFDSYVKGKLDSGVPVILHIAKYNEATGEKEGYHSIVAYYYDSQGIHANFGWGENSTDVVISPEYQITEAGVANFNALGHKHSNNYKVNTLEYCGCGYSHAHSYSYNSLNASSHSVSCSCGYYAVRDHVWTVTSGGLLNINTVVPQYIPLYVCTACGYQTKTPPIGYMNV